MIACAPAIPLPTSGPTRCRPAFLVALALAVLMLLIFGQAVRYGFVSFDDDRYVDHNPALTAGLSAQGWHWAFTTNLTHLNESAEYWEPLTLLSRLADFEAWGFDARGHHATSVLLHLAAACALFGALQRITGAVWRSAMVAALFLIHPMHVEPVLWLSARKDLVNGLFYILTVWAYAWYAERPGWRRYALVFGACLAANMSKPMAVSLPLVLLLLDFWPLERWLPDGKNWRRQLGRLVLEKVPLFVVSIGVSVLAFVVQKDIGAMADDVLPLGWRLGNAALACATYFAKAVVPVNLAFFYPHPGRDLNVPLAAAAVLGLLAASVAALEQTRKRPWLTVGWFWFLVVLAPVSGVIQIGDQALADRYSYLAFIGLFIAAVWQVADWVREPRIVSARAAALLAGAVVVVFSAAAFSQVRTWRNSETLFSHALDVTDENYLAHFNLGALLFEQGRKKEGWAEMQEARRIRGPFLRRQLAAADEALSRGSFTEAVPRLVRVLMLQPWDADLHQRLGAILVLGGEPGKALAQFAEALKYRPDWIEPRLSMSEVLIAQGEPDKAGKILRGVLAREPGNSHAQEMIAALGVRAE